MATSESKKKIVIDNYFHEECDSCESIKEVFTKGFELGLKKAPVPQTKTGKWILTQRGKHIDVCCSECGYTRVDDYAYGYTIDELNLGETNDFIVRNRMNYCECCGARMEAESEESE